MLTFWATAYFDLSGYTLLILLELCLELQIFPLHAENEMQTIRERAEQRAPLFRGNLWGVGYGRWFMGGCVH